MKLYNFARLIKKYSVSFHFVVKAEGHYDSGKWVPGEEIMQPATGAIVPMSDSKIRQSGGVYTSKDRELYMMQPIPLALQSAKVCYKGNLYSIESETNFEDYADVAVYSLKWVSLFDREETP